MNLLLVLMNVIGFVALAGASLKILEAGPTFGPAFSHAARCVLLVIVFLALFAAIETLAWRATMRPAASFLVFIVGLFSVWRAFAPAWASFWEKPLLPLSRLLHNRRG